MSKEKKIVELTDEDLMKVTGGKIGNTAPNYSCRAEGAATDVTVKDHIRRKSDDNMFECDGYVNANNQTLWTFRNLDKPNERIMFAADSNMVLKDSIAKYKYYSNHFSGKTFNELVF